MENNNNRVVPLGPFTVGVKLRPSLEFFPSLLIHSRLENRGEKGRHNSENLHGRLECKIKNWQKDTRL